MTKEQGTQLATLLRRRRAELELTTRQVAEEAGIAHSNIIRIEQGAIASPRPDVLRAIADALDLELADVYAAAGYVQPKGLPSFTPYLRSKYRGLPESAHQELEQTFERIARKHGYDGDGPAPGEDES